jgi:hypothetical protein
MGHYLLPRLIVWTLGSLIEIWQHVRKSFTASVPSLPEEFVARSCHHTCVFKLHVLTSRTSDGDSHEYDR